MHENKFGKGHWVNLAADAHITVTKPVQMGVSEGRDSVKGQLGDMKKTAGEKPHAVRLKKRSVEMAK